MEKAITYFYTRFSQSWRLHRPHSSLYSYSTSMLYTAFNIQARSEIQPLFPPPSSCGLHILGRIYITVYVGKSPEDVDIQIGNDGNSNLYEARWTSALQLNLSGLPGAK